MLISGSNWFKLKKYIFVFDSPFIEEVYKALYLSELPQTLRIQLYLFSFDDGGEAKVNATHLIWQYTL